MLCALSAGFVGVVLNGQTAEARFEGAGIDIVREGEEIVEGWLLYQDVVCFVDSV